MPSTELTLTAVPIPDGAPSPEELASWLEDYEDFECIGTGAMGVVYAAVHKPLGRRVAIKVLSPTFAGHGLTVKRFFREARAMAQISHPNIVPVYEVGGEGRLPYFSMELVGGGSLKDLVAGEEKVPPRRAAEIVRDVAQALDHAHELNILHRDVKPGNVLLDSNGIAKLADFGLVRHNDGATLTATDAIVGTPQYMSPEQVRSDTLDGRSDQFALGVSLYELLTGEPPFQADSPVSVLRSICDAEPLSVRKRRPEITEGLEAVTMRMLEKEPERRYETMAAVRDDLERYLRGEAVEATLPSGLSRSWRRLRNNKLALRFAVAATVAVMVAIAYSVNNMAIARDLERDRDKQARDGHIRQAGLELAFNPAAALAELDKLDPEGAIQRDALLIRLRANLAMEDHDEALRIVEEELLTRWPDDAELLLHASRVARASGDTNRARDWLDAANAAPGAELLDATEVAIELLELDRRIVSADLDAADEDADGRGPAYRGRAGLRLEETRRNFEGMRPRLGGRAVREHALLSWLEARARLTPGARAEALLAAFDLLQAVAAIDFLDTEVVQAALSVTEELGQLVDLGPRVIGNDAHGKLVLFVADEEQVQRLESSLQFASRAVEWAKNQIDDAGATVAEPEAAPAEVKGPLGRVGEGVGGLISNVFGG